LTTNKQTVFNFHLDMQQQPPQQDDRFNGGGTPIAEFFEPQRPPPPQNGPPHPSQGPQGGPQVYSHHPQYSPQGGYYHEAGPPPPSPPLSKPSATNGGGYCERLGLTWQQSQYLVAVFLLFLAFGNSYVIQLEKQMLPASLRSDDILPLSIVLINAILVTIIFWIVLKFV
jgi:hypothetical protein